LAGYFGDHFGECFETYGVKVDYLAPETAGGRASLQQLTSSLRAKNYKGVVITHVDTSTAVLADLQVKKKNNAL
jgi:alanine-glyoxylate transaminase/serine-glyoxylate transaminase/serine-pyruvate transaminase